MIQHPGSSDSEFKSEINERAKYNIMRCPNFQLRFRPSGPETWIRTYGHKSPSQLVHPVNKTMSALFSKENKRARA